ncbi:GNAT family N-acetyltransferase [Methylobacterium sp. Leaf89]|uniref:GNAT family N-acetyltransferase n=1 Tax=Methylobacterium sp. Leaf89 TaxID=1736245 RepID=UPI0006FAD0A5|nr:GNAT family N-acetyltransferase [Methylobacterium sp. Leaf89]KQO67093.1 hypothetical protein ASF18_10390 [Methylobacterium sp. Leaf89]
MVAVLVAEEGGGLVGLASCGSQRDATLRTAGFDGEISALYLRQDHQRRGLGRRLMRWMGTTLMDRGLSTASVWVLRENVGARAFYERLGGEIVGEAIDPSGDVALAEVAYGWRDLSRLAKATSSVSADHSLTTHVANPRIATPT